jgi:hypothetical protein
VEHPKDVGDRSTLAIMLVLRERGYGVYVPFGENTRADLAIDDGRRLFRVQCKTGRLRNGAVVFATASVYGQLPGNLRRLPDPNRRRADAIERLPQSRTEPQQPIPLRPARDHV